MTQSIKTLRDLYQTHLERFAQFVDSFPTETLYGPLLIEPSTCYWKQTSKLLIIGQETKRWYSEYKNIDAQLEKYKEFDTGRHHVASPFWNITRKVELRLGIAPHSCAWSNLNRFDHNGHPPTGEILEEVAKLDFLLRDEIQILRPDICLFYTNRKYDHRIQALYPGIQFHKIDSLLDPHFVRLIHQDLPKHTFRTPHPRTIRTQRWEKAFLTFMQSLSGRSLAS